MINLSSGVRRGLLPLLVLLSSGGGRGTMMMSAQGMIVDHSLDDDKSQEEFKTGNHHNVPAEKKLYRDKKSKQEYNRQLFSSMTEVERAQPGASLEARCQSAQEALRFCFVAGGSIPQDDPRILPRGFCDEPCGEWNRAHFCCCDSACQAYDDCCQDSTSLLPTGPTTAATTAATIITDPTTFATDPDDLSWGGCEDDVFQCPDGNWVARDPDRDCEFHSCSNTVTALAPGNSVKSEGSAGGSGKSIGSALGITALIMAAVTAGVLVSRKQMQARRRHREVDEQSWDTSPDFDTPPYGMQPIAHSILAPNDFSTMMMQGGHEEVEVASFPIGA